MNILLLPREILCAIIEFLDTKDRKALRSTCKTMRRWVTPFSDITFRNEILPGLETLQETVYRRFDHIYTDYVRSESEKCLSKDEYWQTMILHDFKQETLMRNADALAEASNLMFAAAHIQSNRDFYFPWEEFTFVYPLVEREYISDNKVSLRWYKFWKMYGNRFISKSGRGYRSVKYKLVTRTPAFIAYPLFVITSMCNVNMAW